MSSVAAVELREKILIVDDEESIRRTLEGVIRDEGFQAISARSGEEALRLIAQDRPQLVLLDIWMPGKDGMATLQELRSQYPDIPVIMISGHATIATALQATKMGALDFIEKPIDLDVMLKALARALGRQASSVELAKPELPIEQQRPIFSEGPDLSSLQKEPFFSKKWAGRRLHQRTLAKSAILYGHGVHSGRKSGLLLEPLPPNSGVHFAAMSGSGSIPMHVNYVESTKWATRLRSEGVQVSTVEHLLSALNAFGICNLLVKCNEEIPVLDGSSAEYCRLFSEVGIEEQDGDWYEIRVPRTFEISNGHEFLRVEPSEHLIVDYTLEYPEPVGHQRMLYELKGAADYAREIASARTFGFVKDIGALQKAGLAQGGRFDNFVLIGDDGVINAKLRFSNEAVRHKILDILGDFFLLGRRLEARITAVMTGHSDNLAMLKKLLTAMETES